MKTRKMLLMGIVVALSAVTLIGCKTKKELRTKDLEKYVDNTQLLEGFTSLDNKFKNPEVDKDGFVTIAGQKLKTKDVYKAFYQTEIDQNFNYLINEKSWNLLLYTNMVEGLIGNDKHGNLIGLMAKGYKKEVTPEGNSVWTLQLRENVRWVDNKTGKFYKDAVVDAEDFVTAAKYVLTPTNGSGTAGFYTDYILNADKYFKQKPESPVDFNTVGVKAVSKYQVQFTNKGNLPYFLSILTYSPFLPVEAEFLAEQGSEFAKTFNNMLVNGAFLVNEHRVNNKIIYEKNLTYWNENQVYFNWAEFKYLDGKLFRDSLLREWFEASDIDSFVVNQRDKDGWEKYVVGEQGTGSVSNPIHNLASSEQTDGDGAIFYGLFNFNRKTFTQFEQKTEQQKKATSLAVRNLNFRKAFLYGMNFKIALEFHDPQEPTIKLFRGLTSPSLVNDGNNKDYSDYVSDVYNQKNGTNISLSGLVQKDDAVYNLEKAKKHMEDAKTELIADSLSENDFPILLDVPGYLNVEQNAFHSKMYNNFMKEVGANGSIVKIREAVPADRVELNNWIFYNQNYDFSFYSGWGPDFADPSTFLSIVAKGGPITKSLGLALGETSSEEEKQLEEQILGDHTRRYEQANKIVDDYKKRLEEFAKVEYDLIFKDVLLIPWSSRAGKNVIVSRTVPFTRAKAIYGLSSDRIAGIIALEEALTNAQRLAIIEAYNNEVK